MNTGGATVLKVTEDQAADTVTIVVKDKRLLTGEYRRVRDGLVGGVQDQIESHIRRVDAEKLMTQLGALKELGYEVEVKAVSTAKEKAEKKAYAEGLERGRKLGRDEWSGKALDHERNLSYLLYGAGVFALVTYVKGVRAGVRSVRELGAIEKLKLFFS